VGAIGSRGGSSADESPRRAEAVPAPVPPSRPLSPSPHPRKEHKPDLPTTLEREETRRLRQENFELRRANEILKSASLYFAREVRPGVGGADG
jgi:transposase